MMAGEPDVLIVGAGPTGLCLANALAEYGVPFTIIDRKPGTSADSKALAINAASQLGLASIGIASQIGRNGSSLHRLSVFWEGTRLTAFDMRRCSFADACFIAQPQSRTELELLEALENRGHSVQWSTELCDVSQNERSVDAQMRDAAGKIHARAFAYVVGCDGKQSAVRPHTGASLSGTDYGMHFVLGDFELTDEARVNEACYHVYDDGFFIIVPAGKRRWRVLVKHDGPIPERTATPEDITRDVTRRLGRNIFVRGPFWLSRAPFYLRVADRMRLGRLFLAGDAAHLFSPIGGTGMNTGIQDALNLAWKLAYVLSGAAKETLLNSYEAERLHEIKATAAVTDNSTRLITRLNRDIEAVLPILPRMNNRHFFKNLAPLRYSGLAPMYAGLLQDKALQLPGAGVPGTLCTGLISDWPQQEESLPQYTIVAFPPSDEVEVFCLIYLPQITALMQRYNPSLRAIFVAPSRAAAVKRQERGEWIDPDDERVKRLAVVPGALLLVRPDRIIHLSVSIRQHVLLASYLGSELRPGLPQFTAPAFTTLDSAHPVRH